MRVANEAQRAEVSHGVKLPLPAELEALAEGARVQVLDASGTLLALAERQGDKLRYLRVLMGSASADPT